MVMNPTRYIGAEVGVVHGERFTSHGPFGIIGRRYAVGVYGYNDDFQALVSAGYELSVILITLRADVCVTTNFRSDVGVAVRPDIGLSFGGEAGLTIGGHIPLVGEGLPPSWRCGVFVTFAR